MSFKIKIDDTQLKARFNIAKSVAYGTVNAINETAKQVQAAERDNVRRKFHVRPAKAEFMMQQAAIIKPFASVSQGRPYADVSVGKKDRLLLATFEHGGQRLPFIGKNEAIPIIGSPARPSIDESVPVNLQVKNLNMAPQLPAAVKAQLKSIKGSTRAETAALRKTFKNANSANMPWKGRERTYMIPGVGIFQRTGPGKRDSTLLYAFKPLVNLKPILNFGETGMQAGQRLLAQNIHKAVWQELVVKWAK
jgi:hypothetical protein